MFDIFSVQNDLKQGDALSSLLFNFAFEYTLWWYLFLGLNIIP